MEPARDFWKLLQLIAHFGPAALGAPQRMSTRVGSFGFKYGAPVDADLVFDVRFLKNPYFVPELKRVPGTDARVQDYVMGLPETAELLEKTLSLLDFVIPKYEREGKSYLTIAFGCTGGMHRSVVLAEAVAAALDGLLHERASRPAISPSDEPKPKIEIAVVHRDIARGDPPVAAGGPPASSPKPGVPA